MSFQRPGLSFLLAACCAWGESSAATEDWPQWRGVRGNAMVADFAAPAAWPEKLTQKWQVAVGDGVATPALVGNRLYVYARQDGNEILRCLELSSGTELWRASHAAKAISGPADGFPGPRCSPAVAHGSVVVVGVHGDVACYDAENGDERWRITEFEGQVPRFNTSSSPLIFDEQCIVQLGDGNRGGVLCLKLADGSEVWRWDGQGPDYASPTLAEIDGQPILFAATTGRAVALHARTGALLWEMEYVQGRYNATSPTVHGNLLLLAGPNRGVTALRVALEGDKLTASEAWRNDESTMVFNTPVATGEWLFGLTGTNQLFCLNLSDGRTTWTAGGTPAVAGGPGGPPAGERRGQRADRPDPANAQERERGGRREGAGPPSGGGRGGRAGGGGGRGGGRGGYGSVVEAGPVLFTLTPAGQLNVVALDGGKYQPLVSYPVAKGGTYAYPVIVGHYVLIKDADSLTLWEIK